MTSVQSNDQGAICTLALVALHADCGIKVHIACDCKSADIMVRRYAYQIYADVCRYTSDIRISRYTVAAYHVSLNLWHH